MDESLDELLDAKLFQFRSYFSLDSMEPQTLEQKLAKNQ
jgi:hypothetical protein